MRFVLASRRGRLWLLAAAVLAMATQLEAKNSRIGEVVKQVIPKFSAQLAKVAVKGKVDIAAACIATACVINFATPAEALPPTYLNSDAELTKSSGAGAIFTNNETFDESSSAQEQSGIEFGHWIGTGVYHENGSNLGTVRAGATATGNGFSIYLKSAYRYHHDTTNGIDDIALKTRTFAGLRALLIDSGEGQVSYGYVNTKAFVGATHLNIPGFEGYLLHYHLGPFQAAAVGYEYVDTGISTLDGADGVRSHGASLYRAAMKYPLTSLFTTSDAIGIDIKLNSTMHLGDIGPVKLGETWQGELNDWTGEDNELEHRLYHRAGGSINLMLADGRINLAFGGAVQHSIDGKVDSSMHENGDFSIVRTTLLAGGTIKLLPSHNITLEGFYERYDQSTEAEFDGKEYDENDKGTWARVAITKAF